jgi:ribosome biogenesis GTPase
MDRFTSVAAANDLPLLVVVNKCDLVEDPDAFGAPYAHAGYPVVYTSVPERRGLEELHVRLKGSTSLLAGPTGVGKSSLLNALVPGLRLRTSEVSAKSRSGRHTTVAVELHAYGSDGFVADTPGLRDIGMWGLDPRAVMAAFPEIASLADGCRFDNCRHLQEPACAVVAAVARGALAATRLESYRRMLEEAQSASRPWTTGRDR